MRNRIGAAQIYYFYPQKDNVMTVKSNSQSTKISTMFIPFLTLTFGLTWGIAAVLILFSDQVTAIFGELGPTNPLFILAVYSPGIVAVFLVWRKFGGSGLGRFFRRLTLWRMSAGWWLFIILVIPTFMYLGAMIKGSDWEVFPFSSWQQALLALALALFLGPIEEFGWRGVALPLLQRKYSPFWASIILGTIWMIWHIPAFLIGGTLQSGWAFLPYFAGGVAMSVVFTAIFNSSGGSLLIAVLLHFQLNNPIWPDAQPWDNLFIAIIAIIVVWVNRRTIFQRDFGVTDILMPE